MRNNKQYKNTDVIITAGELETYLKDIYISDEGLESLIEEAIEEYVECLISDVLEGNEGYKLPRIFNMVRPREDLYIDIIRRLWRKAKF